MAILKIIAHGKTNAGKRRLLQYVLDSKKTEPHLCAVTGEFRDEEITPQTVYQSYARTRALFNKESHARVRTYTHGTVSFAPGEILPEDASQFAEELVGKIFPAHQVLTAVHTDAEHIHAHFVVETVSFCDGSALHMSKRDLEKAKEICNEMCRAQGLSVAEKGRHADGRACADGEVTAWSKDKYRQMAEKPGESFLVELASAVQDCAAVAEDKDQFCDLLEHEYGWQVIWRDTKKAITFVNGDGKRIRDSNLSKTFNLNISKEALQYEFARNSGQAAGARSASQAAATGKENPAAGRRESMAERTAEQSGCGKHSRRP